MIESDYDAILWKDTRIVCLNRNCGPRYTLCGEELIDRGYAIAYERFRDCGRHATCIVCLARVQ